MNKKRVFYYDALRALAIFGIITCHMTANFITNASNISIYDLNWMFLLFFNSFRQFSIPVFVMISGALLINKDYSLSTFIKKKFNRIFIPYVFWAIVLVLFSLLIIAFGIKSNTIDTFSLGYLIKCFLGLSKGISKGRHLWFIWMILLVYVILFLLNKVLNRVNEDANKKIITGLTLIFIIYCVIFTPLDIIRIGPFKHTLLYYISFAGYGILGYFLAKTDFTNIMKNRKISKRTIFAVSSILFAITYIYFLVTITNLSVASNHFETMTYFGIVTLLLSSSIFLSFRYFEEANEDYEDSIFMKIKKGKAGAFINSLSKCSFGIYFIHPLVFICYKDILFGSINILKHDPIKWSSLLIVLVLFTSWAIIWAMSKIPYLEKVSGA